jgi:hypothetical protein
MLATDGDMTVGADSFSRLVSPRQVQKSFPTTTCLGLLVARVRNLLHKYVQAAIALRNVRHRPVRLQKWPTWGREHGSA